MNGLRRWVTAAAIAAAVAPAAPAGDPPSVIVDRWHQHFCPRDLTPQVSGPFFGYFETRWRVMSEDGLPTMLPPTVIPPAKVPDPKAKGKPTSKPPAVLPAKASVPAEKAPGVPAPSPYAAGR